jgi:hypothetical protein
VRWILFTCFAGLAFAQGLPSGPLQGAPQGTQPKAKPDDYEVHAQAGDSGIGAEFMVHSFSGEGQTYIAKDYLVVEVALFPAQGNSVEIRDGAFGLRINAKKTLLPETPYMVASELQHPDWQEAGPHVEAGAGAGNAGVIFGAPPRSTIPGVEQPGSRLPPQDNPSGVEKQPPVPADVLVVTAALPEGGHKGPVSGFLYFRYSGKISAVKSLVLVYEDAELKLR